MQTIHAPISLHLSKILSCRVFIKVYYPLNCVWLRRGFFYTTLSIPLCQVLFFNSLGVYFKTSNQSTIALFTRRPAAHPVAAGAAFLPFTLIIKMSAFLPSHQLPPPRRLLPLHLVIVLTI